MYPNYLSLCFFICLVMSSLSFAQEDERGAILETVEEFFTAIRTTDKQLLAVSYTHLTLPTNREV